MGQWGRKTKQNKTKKQNLPKYRKKRGTKHVLICGKNGKPLTDANGKQRFHTKNIKTPEWEKI